MLLIYLFFFVFFFFFLFFFNDTATTEIYTLSLHDALPICSNWRSCWRKADRASISDLMSVRVGMVGLDRKSTRLNSSHANISYAVFCLKKKKKNKTIKSSGNKKMNTNKKRTSEYKQINLVI